MDKETSQLVYELAVQIFVSEAVKDEHYLSTYDTEHLANYSIERAREFVQVAKERGIIKAPAGFNFLAEGEK